jgi:hypothetical protein
MKEDKNRSYENMTKLAGMCGMIPYIDARGNVLPGIYKIPGTEIQIDLTACAENVVSILKTACQQMADKVTTLSMCIIED